MEISVAIVENDLMLCEGLQLMLNNEEAFRCVAVFHDGASALAALPALCPDIILMDIDLGANKMTGIDCIRALKTMNVTSKCMVLTIFEDDAKVFEALKAGAGGYVLKSSRVNKIIESIIDLHEGGAPMTPQIARKVVLSFEKNNAPPIGSSLLTTREREIIELISKGRLEKEVGYELFISLKTVKKHIGNIYAKLEVNTRVEALNKYYGRE